MIYSRLVRAYHHATELPKEIWRALSHCEATANVILPFAHSALNLPRGGGNEQLWIAVYDDANNVEFVLSCTEGPLGQSPIFIVACKSLVQEERRNKNFISDALSPLVHCLLGEVRPQRVFSVFSVAKVAAKFAEIFEADPRAQGHGIRACKELYYDATFTFCTGETLKKPKDSMASFSDIESVAISLRPADMSHLNAIADMCKAFSETSPPFVLDDAGAVKEARKMIANGEVWVHIIESKGGAPEVTCLVATTRQSDNVTAVTKVFTPERWRGRGCAARLLYRVCEVHLQKKKRVVLYVGNSSELAPARKVYGKIGFQGLNLAPGQHVRDVERWVEIGFTNTTLGYW